MSKHDFDFSKLTAQDAFVYFTNAKEGDAGVTSGTLYLIVKSGIDLESVPITGLPELIKQFQLGFNEFMEHSKLANFFKGAPNVDK